MTAKRGPRPLHPNPKLLDQIPSGNPSFTPSHRDPVYRLGQFYRETAFVGPNQEWLKLSIFGDEAHHYIS